MHSSSAEYRRVRRRSVGGGTPRAIPRVRPWQVRTRHARAFQLPADGPTWEQLLGLGRPSGVLGLTCKMYGPARTPPSVHQAQVLLELGVLTREAMADAELIQIIRDPRTTQSMNCAAG